VERGEEDHRRHLLHREQIRKQHQRKQQAAVRIQGWWAIKSGNYAKFIRRRASIFADETGVQLEAAVLRVQAAWRKKKGGFGKMLVQRGKAEVERARRESCVEARNLQNATLRIQGWWHKLKGSYTGFILQRAQASAEEGRKREAAVLRVQAAWRKKKGGFGKMLVQRGKAEVERARQNKMRKLAASRIQHWQWRRQHRRATRAAIRLQMVWYRRKGGVEAARFMVRRMKQQIAEERRWATPDRWGFVVQHQHGRLGVGSCAWNDGGATGSLDMKAAFEEMQAWEMQARRERRKRGCTSAVCTVS
jgi:hypothetical protein